MFRGFEVIFKGKDFKVGFIVIFRICGICGVFYFICVFWVLDMVW